jgi:ribosomal protein S18 acetylase RimI-like enzyme
VPERSEAPAAANPAAIEVRVARPEEYAAVGALVADTYEDEGFVRGPYLATLRDAAGRAAQADLLVAVGAGGALLGTVTYVPGGTPFANTSQPGEAEFRMLAVAPGARRRGVGERLIAACLSRARADGYPRIVISTDQAMRAAHRLYERLGFARVPDRDWSPEPGVNLRVYAFELESGDGSMPGA